MNDRFQSVFDKNWNQIKVFCDVILSIKLCTDNFNSCLYFDALVYFDVLSFMFGLPFLLVNQPSCLEIGYRLLYHRLHVSV
jgi:hypothetical protein